MMTLSKPIKVFAFSMVLYVLILAAAIYIGVKLKAEPWFHFGLGIGAIFVFFASFYFYDYHLRPYKDDILNNMARKKRTVSLWILQWILPAMAIQLFVVVGFWITVAQVPFKENIYIHPFQYGQVYKKMNNYLEKEVADTEFVFKLLDKIPEIVRAKLIQKGQVLEDEFSGYLKKRDIQGKLHDEEYFNQIISMISDIYMIPFSIALAFSFLGTLIYCLNDTAYRLIIEDLYPKTYVSYSTRFIFAPSLSIVIAYFMMNDWWSNGAPALFFFVGFFPQLALQFIEEKMRGVLKFARAEKREMPLGLIQGVTDYVAYRLKEIGICDAQNLAYADLNYLRRNWYNDRQLCDFVAQAILLITLKDDFDKLQSAGIRNIIAFKKILGEDSKRLQLGRRLALTEKLDVVNELIKSPALRRRINVLEEIIEVFDRREIRNIQATGVTASF